ncbi:hypothetical protein CFR78_10465 [Komagataeibacter rhaeticus]|uniref:hypothetical protein n=1 Tax=Komagataeibacter rhaeticus TaxID=215221 RepID=UPI0006921EB9|nr:hypothetical protein [Komagataeibacter rhaeticus]PYD53187.1 hypothetical protein CFR78_10465 [Komagataeibacter rhaeticus]
MRHAGPMADARRLMAAMAGPAATGNRPEKSPAGRRHAPHALAAWSGAAARHCRARRPCAGVH